MVKLTDKNIKGVLHALLYIMLLILFYLFYMKSALDQFIKGSTTIVQRRIEYAPDPPVLIACPDPPFKTSFFKNHGLIEEGSDKYFWVFHRYRRLIFMNTYSSFKNYSSKLDLYMDMSFELGIDWKIFVTINGK